MARSRALASNTTFKIGDIVWSSRPSVSTSWLLCDGSAVSRSTYSQLFAIIGTSFGIGDNTTTINLPDARGRSPMGTGTGVGLNPRTIGTIGGAETHTLDISQIPTHTHTTTFRFNNNIGAGGTRQTLMNPADTPNAGDFTSTSASTGSGASHNNLHPFFVLNCFIYTGV